MTKPTGRPRGRPTKEAVRAREDAARKAAEIAALSVPAAPEAKSDVTSEITKERPAHLWKPGQSGNPGGRPKGYISFGQAYSLVSTLPDEAVDGILDGKFPKDWDRPRSSIFKVAARAFRKMADEAPPSLLSEVADRTDGKVAQHITQTLDVKGIIALPAPPPGIAWAEVIEAHLASGERKLLPEGEGEGD